MLGAGKGEIIYIKSLLNIPMIQFYSICMVIITRLGFLSIPEARRKSNIGTNFSSMSWKEEGDCPKDRNGDVALW